MGWKEILGKREVSDQEPCLLDRQQILAYLEELCRLRTPCQLKFRQDDFAPAGAKVESVSEEAHSFTVSLSRALPADIDANPSLEFTFPLDRGRFLCSVIYQHRGGYLQAVFGLPLRIKLAERRTRPRARFGPRERASVTLIETLGSGIGATGKLRNLSMGGLSMRIDRMISIADDRRLNPTADLFAKGQKFMLLRIGELPRSPLLECSARIAHAVASTEGPLLGIEFEGLGALETRILEQVLQRRLPRAGHIFPLKVRHSHIDLENRGPVAQVQAEEADWDLDEEADAGDEPATVQDEPVAEEPHDLWPDRSDPREKMKRLKRAGRNLLLVVPDDMDRAILAGTLIVDGFRRVREARNFVAAVESIHAAQPDLVILDQRIGSHDAQQFLDRLRQNGLREDARVVLLADKLDVRTTIMAKAARINHVQTKPVDYDGFLRGVLEGLLNLE